MDSNPSLDKLNLPKINAEYTGRTAVISGYGYTSVYMMPHPLIGVLMEVGGSSDRKLSFAEVDIISNAECTKKNHPTLVYDSHICGQVKQRSPKKTEGVCTGDSGGPLVIDNDVVIGIVSTSPLGCDESEEAATYTRVSSHLSFVEKVLKDESTTGIRVFKVPDGQTKPTPLYSSDEQDYDIFSIPQYKHQYPQADSKRE